MPLNLENTIQSALAGSHWRTLAKYTNNNTPTVHARTRMNEDSQERGQTYRRENRCVLRFDLNVLRVDV